MVSARNKKWRIRTGFTGMALFLAVIATQILSTHRIAEQQQDRLTVLHAQLMQLRQS